MAVVLTARDLTRHYEVSRGMFKGHATVRALNGVSFELEAGKTLAVVGESGCGKSTLARALTLIEEPSSGSLKIAGQEVAGADKAQRKQLRKDVQMVFQSPYASLNPRQKVGDQLAEPLLINTNLSAADRRRTCADNAGNARDASPPASSSPGLFHGAQPLKDWY